MKNVLLGTSAIALAVAAAPAANAADWKVGLGGYAWAKTAYASVDVKNNPGVNENLDGIDMKWDGEIHFKPEITLDNGIKIGANIQLEGRAGAGGTADTIDEAYIYVSGSFGRLDLGDENSAGYKMTYAAPHAGIMGHNSPSTTIFVPYSGAVGGVAAGGDLFRGTLGTTFLENERNNDATRFTYYTPRMAGFQLGVSYARDGAQNSLAQVNNAGAAPRDIIDIGANYVNSFGDFNVALSGRWGIAGDDRAVVAGTDIGEDSTVFGAGVNLGFGGFTIGGSWAEQNGAGDEDGTSFDVGARYNTGPWSFSATWFHGENVDEEATVGPAGTLADVSLPTVAGAQNDESVDNYVLSMRYALGKGVNVGAYAGYTSFDEETGGANNRGHDIDGFYVGGGIAISF